MTTEIPKRVFSQKLLLYSSYKTGYIHLYTTVYLHKYIYVTNLKGNLIKLVCPEMPALFWRD